MSPIAHPFHIHDVQFYVLDRNGFAPPASEQGRKDVILIHPMETVRFITQFTDFANDSVPYMLHCHMLTHEDKGMMLQFEVVDLSTGTGLEERNSANVNVYPNPVKESNTTFTISGFNGEKVQLELYNMHGQKLAAKKIGTTIGPFTINLPGVPPGTYLLRLYGDNIIHAAKIVIE